MSTEYQPGVCNIGRAERRKRYALGVVGFAVAVVFAAAVLALSLPSAWLLATAVPLLAAFEGYYQGRFAFCAGFADRGIYDVSDDGADRRQVADEAAHRADQRRARRIHLYSVGSAVGLALVVYVLALALGA